ncbi:MAG: hypothetical protein F4176_06170 [Acidimicrobiia bacterium]|nr:hypothetical protein [Acidimicrobiia bacterium]
MIESREEQPPDIAGIVRDPRDEIEAIQSLLADVYRDAGDGRTLFRELVQNADDAEARRLTLVVLEDGWRDAQNSLLRGPALLVANDGPFPTKDREALHKAIGGSKKADVDKIGTFGIGLKSVFHICEAFLYIGAAQSEWWPGVLNPWYGTGEDGRGDPLFPDWDVVGEEDRQRLRVAARHLLGETDGGLLLWIPLRRNEHDRGTGGRFWLASHCPVPQEICSWFGSSTPAALLLAQCGHLQSIDTRRATNPETLSDSVTLMSVSRPPSRWLGRYQEESTWFLERRFGGEIAATKSMWSVVGVESLDGTSLVSLRDHTDWPRITVNRNGRHEWAPRKALAHAAVTVLRPVETDAYQLGTRLRWAVFLPLDDHPEPGSSAIVKSNGPSPAWDIILHGYFWPSQDRRSVPGVTDQEGDPSSGNDMRVRWNRRLCEELLLPLLPRALAAAVDGVEEEAALSLLQRVEASGMLENRMPFVTRRHWLLPVLAYNRAHWKVIAADASLVLSIPNWGRAPEDVRERFLASCRAAAGDTVFIEETAPRLSGELGDWTVGHLELLLGSIPVGAFASVESLRWMAGVASHILGMDERPQDARMGVFIRWLVQRIGEGALTPTTRQSFTSETREELRAEWRNLCRNIPDGWLVETAVDSRQAVQELANCDGILGKGLFLLPVGRRSGDPEHPLDLDSDQLDRALTALGNLLQAGGESEGLRRSRLLLNETLLSARLERHMDAGLCGLPILRVTRLPDEIEEAWSVADLRRQIENRRVFDRGDKAATKDLSTALDAPVWLVSGEALASIGADVPTPEPEALADAVLQAREFAESGSRRPLIHRLVSNISGSNTKVHLAARALLAGHTADVVGLDTELFQARGEHRSALLILLRLLDQSWRAVDRRVAGSLSHNTLEAFSVSQADLEALHRLLDECLVSQVDWTTLRNEEALLLLKHSYSTDPALRHRWRDMPLHRDIDGMRGAFDDSAKRSGRTSETVLPSELRADVCILDPEPGVANLYEFIPALSRDHVLRLMLEASRPWCFAERIVQHLRSDDGQISPPRDLDLRQLLRTSSWLPDRDGEGLSPDAVLIAPEELLDAAADLAESGAFGAKKLPDSVDPQFWQMAEPVVREILGRRSHARQVERLADAMDPDRVARVDGGAWLVMSEPERVDGMLIDRALETTLSGSHRGWKFLHTVNKILRRGATSASRDDRNALLKVARSLCAPVPWVRQIEVLTLLADSRPAKDSAGGRTFRWLLGCFAALNGFFEQVLPELDLPTRDGNWHVSRDVARTETGVARQHLLVSELRPTLGLDGGDRPSSPVGAGVRVHESAVDALRDYFEAWRGQLPPAAVGAFLSLLGGGSRGEITKLATEWLGDEISPEALRTDSTLIGANGKDPCAGVVVWVSPRAARGDRVLAANVIGEWVEMKAEPDRSTLFAIDPEDHPGSNWGIAPDRPLCELHLRDINPRDTNSSELIQLLGGTVERWATEYLKLDRDHVRKWWSRWAGGSKVDLDPVLASILAHMPLTLRLLNVGGSAPLREALRAAERAQRKREQAPSDETISMERVSLQRLAYLIGMREHQDYLWRRVNELMGRYGYRADSVLLELAQNADDALAQTAEIEGRPLPPNSRRFVVKVQEIDGSPTVDVMHWGRPINDTGRATFPAGRDRQWDQDLYFMMLMNLSSKPGESPREGSLSSTTGRFGLGFKSVHLVSSSPSVFSGFIAFSIVGGLLPVERAIPEDADSWMTDGRRATLVRMPLRTDRDADKLIGSLFDRFSYARVLLPVFARQIREVVVECGPHADRHAFDGQPIRAASGWSIGTETELPDDRGRWRILRFRPSDSGRGDMGTAALAVGLRDDVPTAFTPKVPFLWNVTPTSEEWACGYVVNGPFKLDPGRTHVSLDDETTLETLDGLGRELGRGLIELHKGLSGVTEARALLNQSGGDVQGFLSSLWELLASGVDSLDPLRKKFVLRLHGSGSGISAWMADCSVVPTNLPAPFPKLLPPLSSGTSWEVAADGLDDPDLCMSLAEVDDKDFHSLISTRHIVSAKTNRLLAPLLAPSGGRDDPARVGLGDFLAELAEKWEYRLTPARLRALRPLTSAAAGESVFRDPLVVIWRHKIRARAVDGSYQPVHRLLIGKSPHFSGGSGGGLKDELLLSGFAPGNQVLDPRYIACPRDWRLLRWLRPQTVRVADREIAIWYRDTDEDLRPAALRYLLLGGQRDSVLQKLIPHGSRPRWLSDLDGVRHMLEDICDEPWRRRVLLVTLFPERFAAPESVSSPGSASDSVDSGTFFKRLSEWWNEAEVRSNVIAGYEEQAWPSWLRRGADISERLRTRSEDHWLALLILGACRGLGRKESQHRGFLDMVRERGWWDIFKNPDDPEAWMRMLREWQDDSTRKLAYARWMSLFPAIYQLSRYREKYVRVLRSARQYETTAYGIALVFAPRANPAFGEAGAQFDAPPAPLDMGRHWVLRELVRLGVVEGEHLYPDCWVPS